MTDAQDLGPWHWYVGSDDHDSEMMQSDSRSEALSFGRKEMDGERFYIVEARMSKLDEASILDGEADCAPFADTRNGEWIAPLRLVE